MAREKRYQRTEFNKKRFGVCKWQYRKFDCIDLFIELLILINCRFISECRLCGHLLSHVLDILRYKQDEIRYINFEKALALAKDIKCFMPYSALLEHYSINRKLFKK